MTGPPRLRAVIVRATADPPVIVRFTASILRMVDRSLLLAPAVRDAIVARYATHGRALAFRRTDDPYAVLVSEVIAQQTQADRAATRWERFMARFPTIEALAEATPAEVLREWQGLGYDRRGLALWRAARVIRDQHGTRVPDSIDGLDALPGVGPYTARAVAAIAFGRPVGAVDVNVRRVIGRIVGGSDGLPASDIQAIADAVAATTDPATWTHAIMDFGATVCRPRRPRCDGCPVRASCRYATTDASRPEPGAGVARPTTPFVATNRWLRGRILDRLREAPLGAWVALDGPIGSHGLDRVHRAATALAAEGMIEVTRPGPFVLHARLATG
jgi:A/G-specific adenine glycosylase